MTRAGQFFRAIFAKITDEDKAYVKKYLSKEGEKLFYGMKIFDQAHSIAVAKTTETFKYEGDRKFLIRLALLHDVGRKNVTAFGKAFCVLMNTFFAKWAKKLSKYINSLYIYYNHPKIGAKLLQEAGFFEEAKIIRRHHEDEESPPLELLLLKKADDMN